jgi:hypothetical protein
MSKAIQSIVIKVIDLSDKYDTLVEELQALAAADGLDRDAVCEIITPTYVAKYEIELNEKGQFDKSDDHHQACKSARNHLLRKVFPKVEGAATASGKAKPMTREQKAALKALILAFGGVKADALAAVRAA